MKKRSDLGDCHRPKCGRKQTVFRFSEGVRGSGSASYCVACREMTGEPTNEQMKRAHSEFARMNQETK